jgi:hypothetical protein
VMLRTKSICNNKHELYWAVNPPFGHYLSQLTYQVTVETSLPATFYQACGNNNILRTANNDHTFRNAPTKGVSYVINFLSDIETLYDCFVACILRPDCFFAYKMVSRADCYAHQSSSPAANICPNSEFRWANYYTNADNSVGYAVSDGPCGTMGSETNCRSTYSRVTRRGR